MKCIFCSHKDTEVKNSRGIKEKTGVWRRRHCLSCRKIFTTKEFAADNLFIVKRSGKRQRFVYEKLFISIFSAIDNGKHNDNGTRAQMAKKITESVIDSLLSLNQKNISTYSIIRIVHEKLEKVNPYFAERYIFYSEYRMRVFGSISKSKLHSRS